MVPAQVPNLTINHCLPTAEAGLPLSVRCDWPYLHAGKLAVYKHML